MAINMNWKNLTILVSCAAMVASCKNGKLFGKKPEKSDVTGWNYNDKNQGGYQVSKEKEQRTGPGLIFVQGGTFTMGATEEDVMGDWNNAPRRVTVNSFYIDRTEVANVHYREYLYWINTVFDGDEHAPIRNGALPDTLVWRSELAYNEPMVEYYFRHPSYNYYPVVGVTWKQANDFCLWRTDRVNELELIKRGFINDKSLKNISGIAEENFNTKSYLTGEFQATPGKAAKSKKNTLKNPNGTPRTQVTFEDGILLPNYRLPTEAEWEYAALGYVNQNPQPSKKEGKRGEELVANKQVYSWNNNVNGLRDTRKGSWQGTFMANFKRGSGDNMGVAGGLNDRAVYTAPVESFYPNGFGVYNMSGNVNEWTADVYRPLSLTDFDDVAPYRGNKFSTVDIDASENKPTRDSLGRIKYRMMTDEESKDRRNYQRADVINYLDGDSLIQGVNYGYGITTLIGDKSRVIKGGSWNDRAYWLSPGTRRFLEEDQASSTVGFRCAMDRVGSPEGNGRKTGINYGKRKQNSRKR
ncbi:gliding motility lipoprotein GldJ [Flavihumibacter cheonanensis]|uniref:SUMF1/EgtB/PvdO family nonheme iron enzyme n=1 Tax=Flavihumibacter cheonanensis TaxID=1442385 RepID=UPI001EF970D8|nr:SUMF1/EgtB/PvdO family nonheme iron enzyme [Flavihumibacter cheonanensis]MCG7754159.1 SUMF1/EgtB/PvdO family nonheme iron enzyme [Flavihumibacter cheonanensis]